MTGDVHSSFNDLHETHRSRYTSGVHDSSFPLSYYVHNMQNCDFRSEFRKLNTERGGGPADIY